MKNCEKCGHRDDHDWFINGICHCSQIVRKGFMYDPINEELISKCEKQKAFKPNKKENSLGEEQANHLANKW